MNADDDLKRVWQSQFSTRRILLNEELILQQLRREQHDLRHGFYGTDAFIVASACAVIGIAIYGWLKSAGDVAWAFLLIIAPMVGFIVFTTIDRCRQLRRHPKREDSIKAWAESMLAEINHRIWLYRQAFWWFVLPIIFIADTGFHCYVAWRTGVITGNTKEAATTMLWSLLESAAVTLITYSIFRAFLKKTLQPRKDEVERLLASLEA